MAKAGSDTPVVGDWLYYFMPDRTPRAALVVRAWDGDRNDAVSVRVFGSHDDNDLALRERELQPAGAMTWYANQVNRRTRDRLTHCWDWRPEAHDALGRNIAKAVPDAGVPVRETVAKAGSAIVLDEPQATPPPPLPVG